LVAELFSFKVLLKDTHELHATSSITPIMRHSLLRTTNLL
jgi:hypothetical protein